MQNCAANPTWCVEVECSVIDFKSSTEGKISVAGYLDEHYVFYVSVPGLWGHLTVRACVHAGVRACVCTFYHTNPLSPCVCTWVCREHAITSPWALKGTL